jgi:pimeloyl-ACP methyl ester carboxylesterase
VKTQQSIGGGRFSVEIHTYGSGEPLLFLHGAGGLFEPDPSLEQLGRDFKVIAPHLPGFGDSTGGEKIDDVIDAALFYHQLMDDLHLDSAYIVGHSMGGMLAAEVAALDVHRARKLVLVAPAGFWLEDHPMPDFFAADAKELPALMFHDPASPVAQAMMKMPEDRELMAQMYVERVKRMTMAGKFLWPIPDRKLSKRAYRISAPTLLVWGASDRIVPPIYASAFKSHIRNCTEAIIPEAGHALPLEQTQKFCDAVKKFLKQ